MQKQNIGIVTTSRADYGLLYPIIQRFAKDPQFKLDLIVSGSHLSSAHDYSHREIDASFPVNTKIDILTDGDSPESITQSAAKALTGFSNHFLKSKPDLLLLLGDRFEVCAVAYVATIFNIPIVHFHGGESSQGSIDEALRHCITKLSAIHFTSTEVYRKRVIQMGEAPDRVFCVGSPGLEALQNLKLLERSELEHELNIRFAKTNVLITFHPITIDEATNQKEVEAFFAALTKVLSSAESVNAFITAPNLDTYSQTILQKIKQLKDAFPRRVYQLNNLGSKKYISLMKESTAVFGNSSSGIIEAPFLKKAVVDVGNRQEGRLTSPHVLHANANADEIFEKMNKALSAEFQAQLTQWPSIYGGGNVSEKVLQTLKTIDFNAIKKKKFYDVDFEIHKKPPQEVMKRSP